MTQMDKVEMLQWLELSKKVAKEDQEAYVTRGDIREADKCATRVVTYQKVIDKLVSIL